MEVWVLLLEDTEGVHLMGVRSTFREIREELWTSKKNWYKMGKGAWEYNPPFLDGCCYVAYRMNTEDSFAESVQISWDDLDD